MAIVSRPEWGARSPQSHATVSWGARSGVTVHYSAGPPGQTPRQIQDFHMDGRGWSDVGYNFLVDTAGTAYEGRGWLAVGAHASGHNRSHIGVCFIGRDGDATPAAKATIRALYEEANRRSGRTLAKTYHGGLPGQSTSCPGADLRDWVAAGMPVDADNTEVEDELIGLSKGDTGEPVKALQALIVYAGGELPQYGVDGDYGDETAAGLLAVRKSVGSAAEPGWGDEVTGWSYAQLMKAVAKNQ